MEIATYWCMSLTRKSRNALINPKSGRKSFEIWPYFFKSYSKKEVLEFFYVRELQIYSLAFFMIEPFILWKSMVATSDTHQTHRSTLFIIYSIRLKSLTNNTKPSNITCLSRKSCKQSFNTYAPCNRRSQ